MDAVQLQVKQAERVRMFSFAEKESSYRGLLAACKKHEASSVGGDASASVCESSFVHFAE